MTSTLYVGLLLEGKDEEDVLAFARRQVVRTLVWQAKQNHHPPDDADAEVHDVLMRFNGEERSFTWAEFEDYIAGRSVSVREEERSA